MIKRFAQVTAAAALLALVAAPLPALAQACTAEQLGAAVDQAGASLRTIMQANQPKLDARIKALARKRGWNDADAEENAFHELTDARVANLDRTANELLAKVDALGQLPAKAVPDCTRLQELEAASLELQAAIKAKSAYLLQRLDTLIAEGGKPAQQAAPAPAAAPTPATAQPPATVAKPAEPKASPASPWSTTTTVDAAPQPIPAPIPAPSALANDPNGYTIEEIVAASSGFFGKVSAGLGSIVEHAFGRVGRPTGYILGTDGGGAFLAGLRYGHGTLYLRSGGTMPIYWHGPSIGFDFGAAGSKVMFLVYRMEDPADIINPFTSIEGSAYVVGGVGINLMTNGQVQMAPIRSGIGLRIGASVGYTRFTRRPTWNPF